MGNTNGNGTLRWLVGLAFAVILSIFGTYFTMSQTAKAENAELVEVVTQIKTHMDSTELHKTSEARRSFVSGVINETVTPQVDQLTKAVEELTRTQRELDRKITTLLERDRLRHPGGPQ